MTDQAMHQVGKSMRPSREINGRAPGKYARDVQAGILTSQCGLCQAFSENSLLVFEQILEHR